MRSFARCVARPSQNGREYPLSEHLSAVGREWAAALPRPCLGSVVEARECRANCCPVCGQFSEDALVRALLFLGGLLHDAGKARNSWQDYISDSSNNATVFHAPVSSALFFYVSDKLLTLVNSETGLLNNGSEQQGLLSRSRRLLLSRARVCIDIADHHGDLSDIGVHPPWERAGSMRANLEEMDLVGLSRFVSDLMGYSLPIEQDECLAYLESSRAVWRKVASVILPLLRRQIGLSRAPYAEAAALCIRMKTAHFIAGDRYHAGGLRETVFSKETAHKALEVLNDTLQCKAAEALQRGASRDLVVARGEAQRVAVDEYISRSDRGIYRISLPTGLGKTMASLRVALTACSMGRADRIVYVGPYISILSQATKEIREASGLEVLEHHHLSIIQKQDLAEDDYSLVLESWQAPVVTTTLNQLFLALFPKRAQHAMRLRALKGAFVIIDEPQVIDREAWKVFLRMLEALVKSAGASALFTTATMPHIGEGLSDIPTSLVKQCFHIPSRHDIEYCGDEYKALDVASWVADDIAEGRNVAVVMNTIGGAAEVYKALLDLVGEKSTTLYFLSGALVPVHKAAVIDEIRETLGRDVGIGVVSTQVLEAGVDLSFQRIYRENPIIPSVVQVAGRANRHGEDQRRARIRVFNYVDADGMNKRHYVYRSAIWREETDRLLASNASSWGEDKTVEILSSFYEMCYERSPDEAMLAWLVEAACGTWSQLNTMTPFRDDRPQIDVFVPWCGRLPDYLNRAMSSLGIRSVEDLYDAYLDSGFAKSLSFAERRLFFSVLQSLSVSLSFEKARLVADSGGGRSVWRLAVDGAYDPITGLSKVGESDVRILWF